MLTFPFLRASGILWDTNNGGKPIIVTNSPRLPRPPPPLPPPVRLWVLVFMESFMQGAPPPEMRGGPGHPLGEARYPREAGGPCPAARDGGKGTTCNQDRTALEPVSQIH